LTLVGVFTGLVVAGQKMSSSILGKLVSANLPGDALLGGLAAAVALLVLLTLLRIPTSLSNCTVGAFVGAALAAQSSVNIAFLFEIIGSWIAIPFLAALVAIVIYEIIVRAGVKRALTTVIFSNRLLLLAAVFLVAFMLGANNIGTIVSLSKGEGLSTLSLSGLDLAVYVATALGMVLFGKKIALVVGEKIVGLSQVKTLAAMLASAIITGVFTIFSIPVSLTQVIIGGMLGAGISQRPALVNQRELGILFASWAGVTIASAALGFALTLAIL
jgi:inorganic phosphate transporter, PiT family